MLPKLDNFSGGKRKGFVVREIEKRSRLLS